LGERRRRFGGGEKGEYDLTLAGDEDSNTGGDLDILEGRAP
jgi:hypothetical protein